MSSASTLDSARRFYAEELRYVSHIRSDALIEAFASVPRERFLGPGPWLIPDPLDMSGSSPLRYWRTADDDPRHVYHNVLVAIDPERQLHNGLPSFLAFKIDASGVEAGQHVVHIGCGTGYYTAIFAHLVGESGKVTAIEVDQRLAREARANLEPLAQVEVVAGNGATHDAGPADVIFVNAGVSRPPLLWLERLRPEARLILPLTHERDGFNQGVVVRAVRLEKGFGAGVISGVSVFDCVGARDDESNRVIGAALARGRRALAEIRSLRVDSHDGDDGCWAHLTPVCISTREAQSRDHRQHESPV